MPTKEEQQHQPIFLFLTQKLSIHSHNALYIEAFTHRHDNSDMNNQRLAFLGDRVISLVIRQHFFLKDSDGRKGNLTEASIEMEKEEYLAEKSVAIGISSLMIGPNIPKGKGRPQSEALEALFGAIYLDQGFEKARVIAEKYLF